MKNPPDFILQFRRTVWWRDYPFQIASVQPPPPLRKNRRRGVCREGDDCTQASQTDNPFLPLVWKRPKPKFRWSVFLTIAKDLTERLSAIYPLVRRPYSHYSSRLILFGSRGPSEFARDCVEDAVQGLGMAMSTVASEKNGKCCLSETCFTNSDISSCVLFH